MNWKRLGTTVVTLCAIAALIYGFGTYSRSDQGDLSRYASRLKEARAAARGAGLATEISDILTEDRKEGLRRYEQFVKFDRYLYANRDLREALVMQRKADLFPAALLEHPEALDLFYETALIEGLSFPKNWDHGLLGQGIEYNAVSRLTQFAVSSASAAFEAGDRAEARRILEAGVHISAEVGDEPVSESVFTWASSSNRLTRTIFRMLERDPNDPDMVELAINSMEQLVYPQTFIEALRGDILLYIVSARAFDEYDEFQVMSLRMSEDDTTAPPEGRHRPEAFETASIEFWMDAMQQMEALEENSVVQGILLDSLGVEWADNWTASQFLSRAFPITYEQIGKQIARTTQLQRLVYTTAKILSHWQSEGELPSELLELGTWTEDGFTGNDFHYETIESGFILQAVGLSDPEFLTAPEADLMWAEGRGYGLSFTLSD